MSIIVLPCYCYVPVNEFSCVWQMGYSSTLAVIGYVYLGETSTVLLRAKTTGVAAGSTGFLNLIVGYCSPLMLTSPNFGVSATSEMMGSSSTGAGGR